MVDFRGSLGLIAYVRALYGWWYACFVGVNKRMIMHKIKCGFVSCALALGLAACQEKHSKSYYFTHPDSLKKALMQCQSYDAAYCRTAYHAAQQMTQLSHAFVASQTNFGQRILRAQIRVVELSKQLKAAKEGHGAVKLLEQQLTLEQQRVNNLLAIVALFVQV